MQPKINLLLDADILIHFHKADRIFELPTIFDAANYLLLDVVWSELERTSIAFGIQLLINSRKIDLIEFPTEDDLMDYEFENLKYEGKGIGESACMAYAKYHKEDIIASSNLKDLLPYCRNNNIPYLTTLDFLCHAMQRKRYTEADCDDFITKVLSKGSNLPVKCMKDYDCEKKLVLKPIVLPKRRF
jgi:hypothetical protein